MSIIVAVANSMRMEAKKAQSDPQEVIQKDKNVAVLPKMHRVSHNLKRIGGRVGLKDVVSAPDKLSRLCSQTCLVRKAKNKCLVNHQNHYVRCPEG